MKKLILIVSLSLISIPCRAGWITTYMAYSASVDAEQAKHNTEGIAQQVKSLQKQIDELKALILKMAEAMDKMDKDGKSKKNLGRANK